MPTLEPTESQHEHTEFSKRAADCMEASNAAHADDVALYDDYDVEFLEGVTAGLAIGEVLSPKQRDRLNKLYRMACESKY